MFYQRSPKDLTVRMSHTLDSEQHRCCWRYFASTNGDIEKDLERHEDTITDRRSFGDMPDASRL